MKVSIITAALNNADTIGTCIQSVNNQSYADVEQIIVDGGSSDGTLEIARRENTRITKVVSEPDNGIYDALNKGISLASGDIIGILSSDDFFAHEGAIKTVADSLRDKGTDSCYSDLEYVDRDNTGKVIRYWKSSGYSPGRFKYGWMPAHPTYFARRWVYEKYGYFNTSFRIAADYELMLRFMVKYGVSAYYIPEVLIKMRMGGISNRSLKNLLRKSFEDYKAWRINGLSGGLRAVLLKNLTKIPQFIQRT